jgi:hypothetical protein
MDVMNWTSEHMAFAMKTVKERFAMNSVAGHFAPHSWVDKMARTVPSNRFDYAARTVVDVENLNLYEPFAICNFTLAQMSEFGSMTGEMLTGEMAKQNKIVTTITRAASALARWHDFLFIVGLEPAHEAVPAREGVPAGEGVPAREAVPARKAVPAQKPADLPQGVVPRGVDTGRPVANSAPVSLRQAALQAERDLNDQPPIPIAGYSADPKKTTLNEGLVAAVYAAVLELESRGYYNTYHLVLGEVLWEELHRPTPGSMVLPKDRIEPTLLGGHCHRTTTLANDEALLASLDGLTFECVVAGSLDQYPRFDMLAPVTTPLETLYQYRVVEPFVPRIRENHAIVRLQIKQDA